MNLKVKTTLLLVLLTAAFAAIGVAGYMCLSGNAAGTLTASADETLCEHVYEDTVYAPTCISQGYTQHTCTLCGYTYDDNYVSALDHSYVAYVIEPTCTTSGYTMYTCRYCNSSYTDNVTEALGHDYSDVTYDATCTEKGYTYHYCLRCGAEYTDSYVDALGHDYAADVTEATCLEGGYTTYTCSVCGDTYTGDEVAALGHDYTVTVREVTCTSYGYTKYYCNRCGASNVTDYVSPTGHDYELTKKVAASEDQVGYSVYTCTLCGAVYLTDFCDSGDDGYYHNIEYEYTAPTCTEPGTVYMYCTDEGCGYTESFIYAPAAGHTGKDKVLAPTCTEEGYYGSVCSVCGELLEIYKTIEATGHTYETYVMEPTCLEGGCTIYYCTVCGDWEETDYTDPAGHTYKLVTSASRSGQTISASYACESCGTDGTGYLKVIFTGLSSGTSYTKTFVSGTLSYANLPADTYTVYVYDTSGTADTLVGVFPIYMTTDSEDLLIDSGSTGSKVATPASEQKSSSATMAEEHKYSVFMQNDEESGVLYITAVCVNCGESMASELTIRVSFADGSTSYLSADESGAVNYAYIPAGSAITVLSADGETLYAFTVADDASSGTAGGTTVGSTTSSDGTGSGTDTEAADGTDTDGTDADAQDIVSDDTDTDTAAGSGSGKAAVCIIIAIVIVALLAFVIYKVLKSRKAKKAAAAESNCQDTDENGAESAEGADEDNTDGTDET